jgi:hypothetical protein
MRIVGFLLAGLFLLGAAACGDDDNASTTTPTPGSIGSTCATPGTSAPAGCWEQVLPPGSGGFIPYPGSGDEPKWEPGKYPMTLNPLIAFNGDLWMTSSTTLAFSSSDGLNWTKHDKNETPGRLAATFTFFDDKLWMLGGSELRSDNFTSDVWSSSDGTTWVKADDAAWPGRDSTTAITFQDKLWVFGGATHRDPSTLATDAFLNDVWSSDDGVNWTQVTAAAPWSPRSYPRIVVRDDEMYLLGGETNADVWKSSNGKDWTQITADAPWGGGREGYGALAFDRKLWVFGGFVEKSTNGVNDVWYSEDGANWERQAEYAPWTPRDPIAIVYKDKLWLFAGKFTGSDDTWNGDMWVMTATPDS